MAKKAKVRRPRSRLLRILLSESDAADKKQPHDPRFQHFLKQYDRKKAFTLYAGSGCLGKLPMNTYFSLSVSIYEHFLHLLEPFSIDHVMGASEQMNTLAFDCHTLVPPPHRPLRVTCTNIDMKHTRAHKHVHATHLQY